MRYFVGGGLDLKRARGRKQELSSKEHLERNGIHDFRFGSRQSCLHLFWDAVKRKFILVACRIEWNDLHHDSISRPVRPKGRFYAWEANNSACGRGQGSSPQYRSSSRSSVLGLSHVLELRHPGLVMPNVLGAVIMFRLHRCRGVDGDKRPFVIWNVWLMSSYLLPYLKNIAYSICSFLYKKESMSVVYVRENPLCGWFPPSYYYWTFSHSETILAFFVDFSQQLPEHRTLSFRTIIHHCCEANFFRSTKMALHEWSVELIW